MRAGSAGRGGLLGDVGLDAAPEGVPREVHGAFEVAAGGDEVGGLRELADGGAGGQQFPAAALEGGSIGGEGFGAGRQGARGGLGGGALVVARGEHLTGGLRRREVSGVGGAEGGDLRAQRGGFGGQRGEGAVAGHFGDDGTQVGDLVIKRHVAAGKREYPQG